MLRKLNQVINEAIGVSIILMLLGIIFIIFPKMSIEIIAYLIAGIFIINGIYLIILEVYTRDLFFPMDTLINGCLSILFGIILLMYPNIFQVMVPIILGIYFIFSSIFKMRLSLVLKYIDNSSWILTLLMTILSIIAGFILIINPTTSSIALTLFAGITLIIYSISDIIDMFLFKKNINDLIKGFKKNIKIINE